MNKSTGYAIDPGWRVLLRDLGVDIASLLRRAGLPADILARTDERLTTLQYFRLWEALDVETGDPFFPIRLGEAFTAESFSPPLFAALCSPNLRTAARRISRYKPLIGPMDLDCVDGSGRVTLRCRWPEGTASPPTCLVLAELVFLVRLARMATRSEVRPLRVTTTRPPDPAEPYREFFGVGVLRSTEHSLTFSGTDADRPFLTENEPMWRTFEPDLRRRLKDLTDAAALSERVGALLLEFLPSGRTSIEEVSERLIMSKRTLQRRLSSEGTNYQEVLRRTRQELAFHYLGHSSLSASEISYLLGFEDPNSFFRAFAEWTGTTPESVRRSAGHTTKRPSGAQGATA